MLSQEYLNTLWGRAQAKKARIAIKTALTMALDTLESSEAGLEFTGELGQLLRDPAIEEPDNRRLSFQIGDQLVEIIIADQAFVPEELGLRHLRDRNGSAEIVCHGEPPVASQRHVISIVTGAPL